MCVLCSVSLFVIMYLGTVCIHVCLYVFWSVLRTTAWAQKAPEILMVPQHLNPPPPTNTQTHTFSAVKTGPTSLHPLPCDSFQEYSIFPSYFFPFFSLSKAEAIHFILQWISNSWGNPILFFFFFSAEASQQQFITYSMCTVCMHVKHPLCSIFLL